MDSVRKIGGSEAPESVVGAQEEELRIPQQEGEKKHETQEAPESELSPETEKEKTVVGAPEQENQISESNEIPVVGEQQEALLNPEEEARKVVTQFLMTSVEVPLLDGSKTTIAEQFTHLRKKDNAKAEQILELSEPLRADLVGYFLQNQNPSSSTVVERDMYNLLMKKSKFISRPRLEKIFSLLFHELNEEYIQQVVLQMAEGLSKELYPDLYIDAYDTETPLATAA